MTAPKLSPEDINRQRLIAFIALKRERRDRARKVREALRGVPRYVRRHMAQAQGTTRRARKARARIRRLAIARGVRP